MLSPEHQALMAAINASLDTKLDSKLGPVAQKVDTLVFKVDQHDAAISLLQKEVAAFREWVRKWRRLYSRSSRIWALSRTGTRKSLF